MEWEASIVSQSRSSRGKNNLSQEWGENILDYIHSSNPLTGKVIWKTPSTSLLSNQQSNLFSKSLNERVVYLSSKPNRIVWSASKVGSYSVKEGYAVLAQYKYSIEPPHAFSFCWNNKILPKAGSFAWMALHNRILTSDHLVKLNIVDPFKCPLCDVKFEIVDHLFVQCIVANQCWNFIKNKLQLSIPLPNSIWDLFQAWSVLYQSSFFACIWLIIPTLEIWNIWWERNLRIFRKTKSPMELVLLKIKKEISEGVNSCVKREKFINSSFTRWDSSILKDWKDIRFPSDGSLLNDTTKVDRASVKWIPPQRDFNNYAKAQALLLGLELEIQMEFSKAPY